MSGYIQSSSAASQGLVIPAWDTVEREGDQCQETASWPNEMTSKKLKLTNDISARAHEVRSICPSWESLSPRQSKLTPCSLCTGRGSIAVALGRWGLSPKDSETLPRHMKQSTNHSSDIHTSHSKQDDETSNNLYGIESGMSVEFIVLPGAGLFGQQHCMESTSMPAQHRQQHAMSCNLLINALHTTKDGRSPDITFFSVPSRRLPCPPTRH